MSATVNMATRPFPSALSAEEINRLPLRRYEGRILVVRSDSEAAMASSRLLQESLLGFDTETRAAFRKGESYPPALVQLAASDAVYIFPLRRLTDFRSLAGVLSAPAVTKAGVAIAHDIRKLQEVFPFQPAGFVELQKLSDLCGIRSNGLRALASIVLGFRVSKGAQRTNWARTFLTDAQLRYAATDAWVCRELYLRISQLPLQPAADTPAAASP